MFRTRWIRKALVNLPFSLGQRNRKLSNSRKPVRLLLEALEDRVTPCDTTSLVPGNIALNFYGQNQSPSCIIPVAVNDTNGGVATSGTVTCNLVSGNQTITLGSATVGANGIANVNVNLGICPANLQTGAYQLEETFSGNTDYFACNGFGNLTITTLPSSVVPVNVTVNCGNTTTLSETASATSPIGAAASNYSVLYEGTGGHNLQISNVTINGNVGVGGSGVVHYSGPGTITGSLDFSASGSGQLNDSNGKNVGPNVINFTDSTVSQALEAVNTLNRVLSVGGTPIAINGTGTIDASQGEQVTINGVMYNVFDVTSYHMKDGDMLTIKGNGNPVVFNFDGKGSFQLGGDVTLANGLSPDQVIWNFTGSGGQVQLNNNASSYPSVAFQGVILAPNDSINIDNSDLIGRVFGGDSSDMQIVSGDTITAPSTVVLPPAPTAPSFTITVPVNCATTTVTGGTITLDLVSGSTTIPLGTATVGPNGVATITVTDQTTLQEIAALPPGSYELVENFSGSGPVAPSTTTSTLTISAVPTTVSVPPVNVTVNNNTSFNITVNVTTPTGPVASGTVTIDLVNGDTSIPLGQATPGPNGTYTLTVTGTPLSILSSLPPGQYQITVNYGGTPGGPNSGSSTVGSLTVQPNALPTTQPNVTTTNITNNVGPGGGTSSTAPAPLSPALAALELALDAAMIPNMNNPGSVGELEMFAQTFLGHAIPTSIPQLLQDIESLVPAAGDMLFPALGFASFLDSDLPIENPMS